MATPAVLQRGYSRMIQDVPRELLPAGACWNLIDFLPGLGAPARERGGFGYASPDLSGVVASAAYVAAIVYANFAAGAKLCAFTDNSHLVTIASPVSATDIGASHKPLQPPVLHREKLIIPAPDGTTAPKYYDGTTLGNLAGSPPAGKYAAVSKDRTMLANTAAKPNYVYFSGAGDPTSWNTTNGFVPFSEPVNGIAALPNVTLAFMGDRTGRIRGSIPPPGSDFIIDDPVFNVGCVDARSIAVAGSICCFANTLGVYLTNGTGFPEDLTLQAGLKNYWSGLMNGFDASTWTIAGGFIRNFYLAVIMNGSTFGDAFLFDLRTRSGVRLSNLKAAMLANVVTVGEELYFASRAVPRVCSLSGIFAKAAGVKNDADGTAVRGTIETGFYQDKGSQKRFRNVYLDYDLRDAGADAPTISLAYITSPESSSYTTLTPALAATTRQLLARVPLNKSALGVGFKISRANAAADCRIYELAGEIQAKEASRRS